MRDTSSLLGSKIAGTGDILRATTSQIEDYQQRFSKVSKLYDLLFSDLILERCDADAAHMTAKKLFGKDVAKFVAIDGTEYSKICLT